MTNDAPPIDAADFAAAMAAFDGFEPAPLLVAAVSGGADSMALALSAAGWARARGGTILALTVDHGLRPESADEAAAVGAALRARGVDHEILTRRGPVPAAGVEAAARADRYRLLTDRCRALGALHLLTAHHADDQAETVLLRLARGSGPDGLAGMAAARNLGDVRLLRPLLGFPAARLRATCRAAGLAWFDDPTNAGDGNARGRLRRLSPALAGEGLSPVTLGRTAARAAAQRRLLEDLTADLAARCVGPTEYGTATIDAAVLAAAPSELALRVLACVLTTIGGAEHPPRREIVVRLADRLLYRPNAAPAGRATTAGGCLLRRGGKGRIVVCREPAAVAGPLAVAPGARTLWDGRFLVDLSPDAPTGLFVAARGTAAPRPTPAGPGHSEIGHSEIGFAETGSSGAARGAAALGAALGAAAAATLPALFTADGRPHPARNAAKIRFTPRVPLAGASFPVVSAPGHII